MKCEAKYKTVLVKTLTKIYFLLKTVPISTCTVNPHLVGLGAVSIRRHSGSSVSLSVSQWAEWNVVDTVEPSISRRWRSRWLVPDRRDQTGGTRYAPAGCTERKKRSRAAAIPLAMTFLLHELNAVIYTYPRRVLLCGCDCLRTSAVKCPRVPLTGTLTSRQSWLSWLSVVVAVS